jgi:hypothetical protein
MSADVPAPSAVPPGNTVAKYGSQNPVVRRLMAGFEGTLEQLFALGAPTSVLDIGCGEGVLTEQWAQALGDQPVVGLDLEDGKLAAEWATRQRPNLSWRMLNVARGAYVRDLGNTPGHVNHWSKRAFVSLLSRHGEVIEARSPFPWTMLLVRVRSE